MRQKEVVWSLMKSSSLTRRKSPTVTR